MSWVPNQYSALSSTFPNIFVRRRHSLADTIYLLLFSWPQERVRHATVRRSNVERYHQTFNRAIVSGTRWHFDKTRRKGHKNGNDDCSKGAFDKRHQNTVSTARERQLELNVGIAVAVPASIGWDEGNKRAYLSSVFTCFDVLKCPCTTGSTTSISYSTNGKCNNLRCYDLRLLQSVTCQAVD